jgi:ABC-2 type transport system ATP-binding protein
MEWRGCVIEVRDLTKHYGGVCAVDALSFSAPAGSVTGFLGPNGAGKSTTMRLILGLDAPSAGVATVNGRPYGRLRAPLREVGAVLDARAVLPGLRGYDHLLALARGNGIPRCRVAEVVELVGLGPAIGRRVKGYSLGMFQRLGIAAALLGDPGVLLFDEPVNGLDPEGVRWVRTLVRGLAAEGRTVLLSSHLMSEMEQTADRLVVIGRGRLIAETTVTEFIAGSGLNRVRVRSPQAGALAAVLERAGGQVREVSGTELDVDGLATDRIGELAGSVGAVLLELSPQTASLESAFMRLTADSVQYRAGHDDVASDAGADAEEVVV